MHEVAQIYFPIHLSSTINLTLFSFPWRIIIKGTHTLKLFQETLWTQKNEEKSARLKTLKDSLGKNKRKKSEKKEQKQGTSCYMN